MRTGAGAIKVIAPGMRLGPLHLPLWAWAGALCAVGFATAIAWISAERMGIERLAKLRVGQLGKLCRGICRFRHGL